METNKLTERGFVSIVGNKPYWITINRANQIWLYEFETSKRRWVMVRQITEADVDTYNQYRVSQITAQLYHDGNRANPLFGKEPTHEKMSKIYPTQTDLVIAVSNLTPDPKFGKIKGAVISLIRESTDMGDLINKLTEAKQQVNELLQ